MYIPNENRYDTMRYRRAGKSGLLLPEVSLGLWHNFGTRDDRTVMRELILTAFDNGITHFDLANNYGPEAGAAETNFGEILASDLKGYRDQMIISTKAGYFMWPGPYGDHGSKKYLVASLDQSLKRMGIDYVDIFYHHRMDPDTPLEETCQALDGIVKSGKALYIGLSNYDGETMTRAQAIFKELHTPYIINQNRYNIFDRFIEKNGLVNAAVREGRGVITFSPLDQGQLSDRYLDGIPDDSRAKRYGSFLKVKDISQKKIKRVRELSVMAEDRGQTMAEFALSWVISHDFVTSVLIGASKPSQILDNIKITNQPKLSAEEMQKVDRIVGSMK
ncbi:MAG: aldo/keto reductase [Lachnospiraceae bacterium]|jgi:L-glyceraldehyde 3-phosphate reductase|nr:aldo/keto reductase [Lachnospiraceae bacterium]MEE3460830.1 aldo/keto reductase [Lachnospiraceae bacterium]